MKEFGTVYATDFFKFAFRCTAGNYGVDTRIFREADDKGLPWMICKQDKHSVTDSFLSQNYVEQCFNNFKIAVEKWRTSFRVIYLFIADRPMWDEEYLCKRIVTRTRIWQLLIDMHYTILCP